MESFRPSGTFRQNLSKFLSDEAIIALPKECDHYPHIVSHIRTTLGDLLDRLEAHDWRHWVFVSDGENIQFETICFVIDTDNSELADDGDTPIFAAQKGLKLFLSVQDIQMVRGYLNNVGIFENRDAELFSVQYYFEWDAYPSEDALKKFS